MTLGKSLDHSEALRKCLHRSKEEQNGLPVLGMQKVTRKVVKSDPSSSVPMSDLPTLRERKLSWDFSQEREGSRGKSYLLHLLEGS